MRPDEQLLEEWRRGNRQAGHQLFDRHFRSLYKFFRTKIHGDIDDLVQKTLLACIHGRDGFRGDSSFRTYMFAAAKHILYREWEQRRRTAERIDFAVTSIVDLGPGVSTAYARRREQRLLLDGLQHLPLEQQMVIELYYVEGFRAPEIARVLDLPEATVRSRLSRGLERLRVQVQKLADNPELRSAALERFEEWATSLRKVVTNDDDSGSDDEGGDGAG